MNRSAASKAQAQVALEQANVQLCIEEHFIVTDIFNLLTYTWDEFIWLVLIDVELPSDSKTKQ